MNPLSFFAVVLFGIFIVLVLIGKILSDIKHILSEINKK